MTSLDTHAIISNCVDYDSTDFAMYFQEVSPVLTALASRERVVGVKQSARAIRDGRAEEIFLACDADTAVTDRIRQCCGALPVNETYTMAQLGRLCGIAVGASVVTLLKK